MDCIVHGVVKSSTQLSDFHVTWEFYIQLPGLTGMARGTTELSAKNIAYCVFKAQSQQNTILPFQCH